MRERDPKDYPVGDGDFCDEWAGTRVWYKGQPRKIGELSIQELRGALIDAHNDLELVCVRLHKPDATDLEEARKIARRHRITQEEEEELNEAEGGVGKA